MTKNIVMDKAASIPKFVESVRNNPCLWDTDHEQYRFYHVKDEAWLKIAEEHNLGDGNKAKCFWKSLRDIHRDSLKRRREKVISTPWKWSKQMAFLIPHMTHRKRHNAITRTAIEQSIDGADIADYENSVEQTSEQDATEEIAEDDTENDAQNDFTDPLCPVEETRNRYASMDDVVDPLRKFFGSMCDSTKMLPEVYQLQIKRKVFEAVTEAEEAYLQTQTGQNFGCSSSNMKAE